MARTAVHGFCANVYLGQKHYIPSQHFCLAANVNGKQGADFAPFSMACLCLLSAILNMLLFVVRTQAQRSRSVGTISERANMKSELEDSCKSPTPTHTHAHMHTANNGAKAVRKKVEKRSRVP